MKISEVIAQQSATLKNVEVTEKDEPREFQKYGKTLRVCNGTIKDDSGEMQLTLWNDEVDQISEGDKIDIVDGWVKEWQGDLQISSGRNGKIAKAGSDSSSESSKDSKKSE
ncbi:MAG: SOSS complex subunit B family protein [Candidatus Undinarchaeales archaeon]